MLQEPRRPWLDADALKAKFLTLSAAAHPDRVATADAAAKAIANVRFAELNAAHSCLRETHSRLAHLLALETGAESRAVRAIAPDLVDLIIPAEHLCREASAFLAEKARAISPLIKVELFERGMAWADKLSAMQATLAARRVKLDAELKQMNETWAAADGIPPLQRRVALPLEPLEEISRSYSYLTRFLNRLQEQQAQMTF
ncbi:MAG: hypothetical protein HY301_13860 [Verrucomicrobia bacterium]|nr:hypothetical protein [Verrucomicrobiota bacterium]